MNYRIRPLEWKQTRFLPTYCEWKALSVFGTYIIFKLTNGKPLWKIEGKLPDVCESIEDGKAQAEKHYLSMLMETLEEV